MMKTPKEKRPAPSDTRESTTTLPNPASLDNLISTVWEYYRANRRVLQWRETITTYGVFVSEVMLQQTQVSRVQEKFALFTARFPGWQDLADATPAQVLAQWQGLGYNRRGLFLHRAARIVVDQYNGRLSDDPEQVDTLPGIGPATASAIVTYAFNRPTVFIETNIRRVFLHHCFPQEESVPDSQLEPLVEMAVSRHHHQPRDWYYALMDYGSYLAKQIPNPNRRSKHYARQSRFEGSDRQIRGQILRLLLNQEAADQSAILSETGADPERLDRIITKMVAEGTIIQTRKQYHLPKS